MPKYFYLHTTLLIAVTAGVYLFLTSSLAPYSLQLVGLLILVFAMTHWHRNKSHAPGRNRSTIPLDLSLLSAAVLLLVSETGALSSPFIFLLYFLLFAVAMLYEIEATLVLTASLVLYFVLYPTTDLSSLAHLGELFGLLIITPLALFTGHEYEKYLQLKLQNDTLANSLAEAEQDTLIFLSTNLKSTLVTSLDRLSLLIPQARVKDLRDSLTFLYQDLKNLYRSADELERVIDKKTD